MKLNQTTPLLHQAKPLYWKVTINMAKYNLKSWLEYLEWCRKGYETMKNLVFMEKCGEIMLAWLRRKSVEMFGIWQEKGIDEDKEIWWGRELAINSFYQSFCLEWMMALSLIVMCETFIRRKKF